MRPIPRRRRPQSAPAAALTAAASGGLSRRALPADQGIHVPFVDVHVFADELASYGPEVRVVDPPELRAQVIARLEAVRAAHGGAA